MFLWQFKALCSQVKEFVHWHCGRLLGRGQDPALLWHYGLLLHTSQWHSLLWLWQYQNVGAGTENVNKWYHLGNSFLLSLCSGIYSGCQTAAWALFLYLAKGPCTSSAVGISRAPLHLPTSTFVRVLHGWGCHGSDSSSAFLLIPTVCHLLGV